MLPLAGAVAAAAASPSGVSAVLAVQRLLHGVTLPLLLLFAAAVSHATLQPPVGAASCGVPPSELLWLVAELHQQQLAVAEAASAAHLKICVLLLAAAAFRASTAFHL